MNVNYYKYDLARLKCEGETLCDTDSLSNKLSKLFEFVELPLNQQQPLKRLCKEHNITHIKFHPSDGEYTKDNIWEFEDKNGFSPFSFIQHADGTLCVWRPL